MYMHIHFTLAHTHILTYEHTHMYAAWKRGLKTGMYYLRTRPKADAIQFTVDQTALKEQASRDNKADQAAAAASSTGGGADLSADKATKGLEYATEAACESCSA